MTGPLAAFSDVQKRARGASLDRELVDALLMDASVMVRAEFADVDARITAGSLDPMAVVSVVANMVKRAVLAPGDGVKSDTAGPFGVTYDNPHGDLYFKASERATLGAGTSVAGGARSVRMGY